MTSVVVKRYIKILLIFKFLGISRLKFYSLCLQCAMSFKIMDLFPIERIDQGRDLLNGQWRRCKW